MEKQPKRFECQVCGFKSVRYKTIKMPGMSFFCCFKCRGSVKETQEYKDWWEAREKAERERDRLRQEQRERLAKEGN